MAPMFCGPGGNVSNEPSRSYAASAAISLAVLLIASFPSIPAFGGEPDAAVHRPDPPEDAPGGAGANEELLYEADPTPNVVDQEPNNSCGGAREWPVATTGLTKGKLVNSDTVSDPEDWSRVLVFRTESLIASTPKGVVALESAPDCGEPTSAAQLDVSSNGWIPLRVSSSDTFEGYHLDYRIEANDAGTGADIPNDRTGAFTVNALPNSNPFPRTHSGSLAYRGDEPLGPDVDWFRVNTGLAQAPDTQNVDTGEITLGLLTVYFNSDCYMGNREFSLFQADGVTRIGYTQEGCGPKLVSCIAASFSAVYAKLEARREIGGAGYDFVATTAPLAVVHLGDGIQVTDVRQPWCDPLTPQALAALAAASGDEWGVIDRDGRVVARVTNTTH